jgi:hypothetical protein
MEDNDNCNVITIPISENNGEAECVMVFPDELPDDAFLVTELLRAVFAPVKVWRACAV